MSYVDDSLHEGATVCTAARTSYLISVGVDQQLREGHQLRLLLTAEDGAPLFVRSQVAALDAL